MSRGSFVGLEAISGLSATFAFAASSDHHLWERLAHYNAPSPPCRGMVRRLTRERLRREATHGPRFAIVDRVSGRLPITPRGPMGIHRGRGQASKKEAP